MSARPVIVMAKFTWLQAWRNRWLWLVCVSFAVSVALGGFFYSLAITETSTTFISVTAAAARLTGVCVLTFFVITALMRDREGRALDWWLALPMSRGDYYFGRWLGMAGLVVTLVLPFGVLFIFTVPEGRWLHWVAAYTGELLIAGSFALFCGMTLRQLPAALLAALSFYALARAIGAISAMALHPVMPEPGAASELVTALVTGLSWLLPDLGAASARVLVYDAVATDTLAMAAQTVIYCALLVVAGLVDFYRREIY